MVTLKEWADFVERITDEIELLHQEVDAIQPLADKLQLIDPDPVELRAAAASLHAFYSGIERVLLLLVEYLGFRHVFRHNYPETLRWTQCSSLFRSMSDVFSQFRTEVEAFLESTDSDN